MDNQLTLCKNCEFFGKELTSIMPTRFVSGRENTTMLKDNSMSGFKMCMHEKCFDIKESPPYFDPTDGYKTTITKTRIAGQAQFNKDGHCPFYKKSPTLFELIKGLFHG